MRVLVVGGGGREHAICWSLAKSERITELACLPGNAGIASVARLIPGNAEDLDAVVRAADEMSADLVVVGPEAPLVAGLADALIERGRRVFGHSQAAAMLEGSKIFAKEFMARHGIPTARFAVCESADEARAAVRSDFGFPVVLKADGLAAGKGVVIAQTLEEADAAIESMMIERTLGDAGSRLLVEEALVGREASLFYFTDGTRLIPTPVAQDHKRVGDGDTGPNTGGMGTFSTDGLLDAEIERRVLEEIAEPTVRGMRDEGAPLSGLMFVGVMITSNGPKVLEYNMRFGDPETQSVLMRLETDLLEVFEACASGSLEGVEPRWSADSALCVVIASGGYPGSYPKGKPISGLEEAARVPGVYVFHAGTALKDDAIVTAGGRVLGVTARATTMAEARARAYEAVEKITFDGAFHRTDIGRPST